MSAVAGKSTKSVAGSRRADRQTPLQQLREKNRELRDQLSQRSRELAFFIDAGRALTATIEPAQVLSVLQQKAQALISCEAVLLFVTDETGRSLTVEMPSSGRPKAPKKVYTVDGGLPIRVLCTGSPILAGPSPGGASHGGARRSRFTVEERFGYRVHSVLAAPVFGKHPKKPVAVIELINRRDGVPFGQNDLKLVTELLGQGGMAIERAELYQQMQGLTIKDDLTKLFNFRYLDQTLDIEIKRCNRYGSRMSLIFLDMDHFKKVNDLHGHLMGSRVLVEVAQILIQNLRAVDVIARYGGDEFVVILPETDVRAAYQITERIQEAIRRYLFLEKEGLGLKLTASFGVAGFPEHARNKIDLIRLSDQAMYKAKSGGRDLICIAEKE